ncbi:MAG: zf-HC2 domain-containing protein [Elusimicrobiota bacterium]
MDHAELKEKLHALRDGELPEAERREVEAHIVECSDCRLDHGRWEKVAAAFFRTPEPLTSEAFVARVMEGVEREETPEFEVPAGPWDAAIRWMVPAFAAASVALILTAWPGRETDISTETLLLADGAESTALAWAFQPEPPEPEALLGVSLEDQ